MGVKKEQGGGWGEKQDKEKVGCKLAEGEHWEIHIKLRSRISTHLSVNFTV